MSCIHYKFRSALEYDTITFDGLSISLADLKHSIITQKKFGKNTDFDLEVTNAQTKEEYKDEMTMIPKNSSVVVRRIPVGTKSKAQLAAERASPFSSGEQKTVADLANADASEEDKLKAMMKQSGEDWEPSQYVRGRRPYAPGVPVPQNYVCYRCGKPGHFIRNCPTNGDNRFDVPKAKRTTGIPRTFLGTAEGTASPPGRSSPSLPEADSKTKGKEKDTPNKKVPSELKCPTCNNLLTDAVLIPCCGTSYCDDCIRNYLLENEQTCPSCRSENVSPDSLVINKQLRQAVNTFKNARPASPYVTTLQKSTSVVSNDLQTAAKVANDRYPPESASSEKVVPDSKPAEHRVVKEVNETESKTKQSSPKRTEPTSQPQPIRVHHREASAQQGVGLKQGGAPFDARRRQGEFLPRAQPRLPGVRHGLSEPIIPHGLPPEHIPRVPAVRPGISGPSHPGPRTNIPGYVPSIRTPVPAAIPRIPPVPTLVPGPLPHHPPFGAPVFDPLRPADGSLTPPMSEREFYKMQKKLKSRTKKKREHEHPSSTHISRESRPRKQLKKEPRKEPKKDGNVFDFDDELSEYRKLQKSRQRLRSRSLTPSRSWSHSPSRSRSRSRSFTRSRSPSRSPSRSSPSPARSPTPEGWDESRSPSPASSRDQGASVSAEDKKRKHKKRKKEQKSKERKKRKTSDGKDESVKEQKDAPVPDKNEEKTSDKKKHKRREKKDSKATADDKDKGKDVGEEKDEKERKEKDKEKDKEERKTKEKLKKKGNDKEKEKKSKKKKGKEKKDESSSGKKRKSKKKHKKHKRHKKEKSKEGEDVKESGKASEKFSTDEHETRESDEDETQHSDSDKKDKKSDEQESISEEEYDNEKVNNVETEEKEQEGMTEQNKEGEKMDVQEVNEASERKGKKPPNLQSDEGGHRKLLGNISDEENDFLAGKEEKELQKKKFEIGNGNGSGLETRNGSEVKKHGQ